MKKLLLLCLSALLLSMVYVTPIWGRGSVTYDEVESDTKEFKDVVTKETFILYAGVEEAFDINKDANEEDIEEHISNDETIYTGWATARVNIRKEPNTDSKVLNIIEFNEALEYKLYSNKWVIIDYNGTAAYVSKKYIAQDSNKYNEHSVPENRGFKSYMSYKTITNKSSKQYKLQKDYAYTGNHGIRMINNRYCIALGTYFNAPIGTYVDLVLENGTTISCIVSEIKSDRHTNSDNIVTSHNGCVSEFLVDIDVLNDNAKRDGDISSCRKDWNSPVARIKVYKKSIL